MEDNNNEGCPDGWPPAYQFWLEILISDISINDAKIRTKLLGRLVLWSHCDRLLSRALSTSKCCPLPGSAGVRLSFFSGESAV